MEATEATSGAGIDAAVPERSRLRRLIEVTAFWCVWIGIGEALDLGPSTGEIETYLLIGVPLVVLFQMIKAIADSQAAPLAIALAVVATAGAAAAGYAYHSVHSSARGATGQGSRRLHPLAPAVHPHRCSCSRKSPSVAPWTRISTIPASAGAGGPRRTSPCCGACGMRRSSAGTRWTTSSSGCSPWESHSRSIGASPETSACREAPTRSTIRSGMRSGGRRRTRPGPLGSRTYDRWV